jgi:hypothetical protein
MSDMEKLNPQIAEVPIGVRDLEMLKIYPLSMADQLELTDIVQQTINAYFTGEDQSDLAFAAFIVTVLKENLPRVLRLITDHTTDRQVTALMRKITNDQAVTIGEVVYRTNYETLLKNVNSLLDRVNAPSPARRPSLPSLNDTADTESKTSPEEVFETEAVPKAS